MAGPPVEQLKHLLRRTEFVVRPQRLAYLQSLPTWEAAVDDVLNVTGPLHPGRGPNSWFDNDDVIGEDGQFDGGWKQYKWAVAHGIDYAARGGSEIGGPDVPAPELWRAMREKMVAFWHGHLVSSWSEVHRGVHLLWQLHDYRRQCLGSFTTMLQVMAISPAMLWYLSNSQNFVGAPNENFSRELMELFTMGVNANYDQGDVAEVARAWTGHNYDPATHSYRFNADLHDYGLKTIFGRTRNWDGPEVINAILEPGSARQMSTARRLTAKLWEYLVGTPLPVDVDTVAGSFVAANNQIKPLVKAILMRPEFLTAESRVGAVRTPFEWLVAVAYHTGMTGLDFRLVEVELLGTGYDPQSRTALTGQLMYQPPNVAGWRTNGYWLNATALSGRAQLARTAAEYVVGSAAVKPVIPAGATVDAAVDAVAAYFGIDNYDPSTRSSIVTAFSQSSSTFDPAQLVDLLTVTMLTPEFNLA